MYYCYTEELSQYSERLRKEPVTNAELNYINTTPLLERYFIVNKSNKPIGFCLLGTKGNTQPGTDWFIAEFWVQPDYRRQNFGENAVSELLKKHPGKYCYFVLNENKQAKMFWDYIKNKFNCKNITANYDATKYTPEDATFYAFETTASND